MTAAVSAPKSQTDLMSDPAHSPEESPEADASVE